MADRIRLRRDTAANWILANPTLMLGEAGVELITGKIKFGDGVTPWNNLSYAVKSLVWRGAYSSGATYSPLDSVSYQGSSYVCTATTSNNAPTNTSFWGLLAQKGADGAAGSGFRWLGNFSSSITYVVGDCVSYQGSSYICILAGTNILPTVNTNWNLIASHGTDGADGSGLVWKGDYSGSTSYVINDVVQYNGASYICIQSGSGDAPTNPAFWEMIADKGANGRDGIDGATGPSGKSFIWMGAYTPTITYTEGNVVSYSGSVYICKHIDNNQVPTNTALWDLMVSGGSGGGSSSSIVWKGAYSSITEYAVNDAVSYLGSSYICFSAATGVLPTNTSKWALLAQKGADGAVGATGATGATGAKGDTPTVSVGSVTTGAAGSSAQVTNSGTSGAAVFNFSIPKGDTGTGIVWKGTYSDSTAYVVGDGVVYQGQSYICKANSPIATLPTDTTKWDLFAAKGADGTAGADGADGTVTIIAGTTSNVFEATTPGQTTFSPINGYTSTNAASYLVSVGAQDQVPTRNYTISSANGGTLVLVEGVAIGTVVSVRAISGAGVDNSIQFYNIPISNAMPMHGQAFVYDEFAEEYTLQDVGGTADTGDVTFEGTKIKGVSSSSELGSLELHPNPAYDANGQFIVIRPTSSSDGQHIHIDKGLPAASLYLGDDNQYVKLAGDRSIEIGVPLTLTTRNYIAQHNSASGAGVITIDRINNSWALDLTNGSTVSTSGGATHEYIIDSISVSNEYIYVALRTGIIDAISVGNVLSFSYHPRKVWLFDENGGITFPDGTRQTSAGSNGGGSGSATFSRTRYIGNGQQRKFFPIHGYIDNDETRYLVTVSSALYDSDEINGEFTITAENGGTITFTGSTPANNAVVVCRVLGSSGSEEVTKKAITTITTQPTSQSINSGNSVSFSVVAAGESELTYQWYRNGVLMSGQTAASLTGSVGATLYQNGDSYYVIVSSTGGSIQSNSVSLTILEALPTITVQPTAQTTIPIYGINVNLSVTATNATSYEWQFRSHYGAVFSTITDGQEWGNYIFNVNGGSLSIQIIDNPSNPAGSEPLFYRALVSNMAGTVESNIATVTRLESGVHILTQPSSSVTIEENGSASISVYGIVDGGLSAISYDWEYSGDGGVNWYPTGVTSATLSFPINSGSISIPTTVQYNQYQYRAIVHSSLSGGAIQPVYSNVCTVTIHRAAPVLVKNYPHALIYTIGNALEVQGVLQSGNEVSYQWYYSDGSTRTAIQNATLLKLTLFDNPAGQYPYYLILVATNSSGSDEATYLVSYVDNLNVTGCTINGGVTYPYFEIIAFNGQVTGGLGGGTLTALLETNYLNNLHPASQVLADPYYPPYQISTFEFSIAQGNAVDISNIPTGTSLKLYISDGLQKLEIASWII